MSYVDLTHLITKNSIDARTGTYPMFVEWDFIMKQYLNPCFIFKTYNTLIDPEGSIWPIGDEFVVPYLQYNGSLSSVPEFIDAHYFYNIEVGCLFRRRKYQLFDSKTRELVSRSGERIRSPVDELDTPPQHELRLLFNYVLSLNPYFYICFSNLHADDIILDSKQYFENLLINASITRYNSEDAQDFFLNPFTEKGGSLNSRHSIDIYKIEHG